MAGGQIPLEFQRGSIDSAVDSNFFALNFNEDLLTTCTPSAAVGCAIF